MLLFTFVSNVRVLSSKTLALSRSAGSSGRGYKKQTGRLFGPPRLSMGPKQFRTIDQLPEDQSTQAPVIQLSLALRNAPT